MAGSPLYSKNSVLSSLEATCRVWADSKFKNLFFTFIYWLMILCVCCFVLFLFVYMCVCKPMYNIHTIEVRGQHASVSFLFAPYGFQGLNSDNQAWSDLSTASSPLRRWLFCDMSSAVEKRFILSLPMSWRAIAWCDIESGPCWLRVGYPGDPMTQKNYKLSLESICHRPRKRK